MTSHCSSLYKWLCQEGFPWLCKISWTWNFFPCLFYYHVTEPWGRFTSQCSTVYINEQACCLVVPSFQDDQEQFQILLGQTEQEDVHICQSKHRHGTADNKRHFTLILFSLYGYMYTVIHTTFILYTILIQSYKLVGSCAKITNKI